MIVVAERLSLSSFVMARTPEAGFAEYAAKLTPGQTEASSMPFPVAFVRLTSLTLSCAATAARLRVQWRGGGRENG
jgi:hypothetical protein